MTLDYSPKGKVIIDMVEYVEKILQDDPLDMTGEAVTPSTTHLFIINLEAEKIDNDPA